MAYYKDWNFIRGSIATSLVGEKARKAKGGIRMLTLLNKNIIKSFK
jgi:hypothetical protein